MLISKFDLYNPEWLEVVFENRNKEYGAYYFRKHYGGNMVKAMGITFSGVFLVLGVFSIHGAGAGTSHPRLNDTTVVTISAPPVPPINKVEQPVTARPLLSHPAPASPTTQFLVMVPTPGPVTTNPPVIDDIEGAVGPETTKGAGKGDNIPVVDNPGGSGSTPAVDNTIYTPTGLDVMPEPAGGESAWNKFLGKNLRFPPPAQEEGVSGRVYLTFIIEKDGSLSNITVIKPAGHGFDEEALRVLKLAKAWKPGMQNGQAVRVKYTIPINFQFADNN